MLSRVAENLYWIGRYVERTSVAARLLDDAFHLELDAAVLGADGPAPLDAVLEALGCRCVTTDRDAVLQFLTFDSGNPQSLVSMIGRARENARAVQETLSSDAWSQVNRLYLSLIGRRAAARFLTSPPRFYQSVERVCVLFTGLVHGNMPRSEAFHFLHAGRSLERADAVCRVIAAKVGALERAGASLQVVHLTSLLRSCAAHEAYLKTFQERIDPRYVLHYLVLDPRVPRSVRFSVDRGLDSLRELAEETHGRGDETVRQLGRLEGELRYADVDEIMNRGPASFLRDALDALGRVDAALGRAYFLT